MTQAVTASYKPKKCGHRAAAGQLSPSQEKFCQVYFATGDVYKAYDEAGYSTVSYAKKRANCYSLRKKEEIRARLRELAEESLENLKERRGVLVSKLMDISNTDITEIGNTLEEIKKLPASKRLAIKSIRERPDGTISVELLDKLKAIELLSRISGLLVERVDVTSAGRPVDQTPVQITFEVVQMTPREPKDTSAEVVDAVQY